MLASASLTEEGVECIIPSTNGLIGGHLAIWLNPVLEAEELPARISNLDACLADVEAECFTHF
jgi:hypothetical protein